MGKIRKSLEAYRNKFGTENTKEAATKFSPGPNNFMDKKELSNGSGSCVCYAIEVRSAFEKVIQFQEGFPKEFIFAKEWKAFRTFPRAVGGVPSDLGDHEANRHGYLGYHQAKALQHWLHAQYGNVVIGLESRLIQISGEFTHKFRLTGKSTPVVNHIWPKGEPDLVDTAP